jgi:hypothetical protein
MFLSNEILFPGRFSARIRKPSLLKLQNPLMLNPIPERPRSPLLASTERMGPVFAEGGTIAVDADCGTDPRGLTEGLKLPEMRRVGLKPLITLRASMRPRGFALVITLMLMMLLTLLAVGLLSLSTISLRSVGRSEFEAQARANARVALMLAIGSLQKQAGLDTRVTARADILDPKNPPVLGVWKSWEGTNHDAQGRPVAPVDYRSAKEQRFLGWMTSREPLVIPSTHRRDGSVALVGEKTVGAGRDAMQVHLEPSLIQAGRNRGGMTWWVAGENQKARIPRPQQPAANDTVGWALQSKSHAVADPKTLRLDKLLVDVSHMDKLVTLHQANLIGEAGPLQVTQDFFHDMSPYSVGLLTNTATGGWRKDLSLMTENWDSLPTTNLPFFRLTPELDTKASKPSVANPRSNRSMLYPWADYRGDISSRPIYQHGPVTSWDNLKNFSMLYTRVTSHSRAKCSIRAFSVTNENGQPYEFLHKVRLLPIIARMQWIFSHSAVPSTVAPGMFEPRLLLTPVITLWNPYNVELKTISSSGLPTHVSVHNPLPVALQYSVDNTILAPHRCLTERSLNNRTPAPLSAANSLRYAIPSTFTLLPGETRLFSPPANITVSPDDILSLEPGYRGTGGHSFAVGIKDASGNTTPYPGSTFLKADAKFDTEYVELSPLTGVGIWLDMSIDGRVHLAYRNVYTPEMAKAAYLPLTNMAQSSLSAAAVTPAPFLSTMFGARMASRTHMPAKGFVQSSPFVNYTALGRKDEVEYDIRRHYGGTNHPVNSPFDYSFIKHAPGGDSLLPNSSDTTNRGYIVTGFNKSDGLSRCIVAEVPTRPLLSLAELQNWDLRYENPIPPFAFNLIGNSDASPLLPPNAVVNSADANLAVNLQHDDSYCANHLLFDDWFFSGIARDPSAFGPSGGRNQQKTFTDFVSGVLPLGNRSYKPIAADTSFATASSGNATQLYGDHVNKPESYRSVASRIEVEGMFNVNSTSVVAWRALLGHARNQRVPYYNSSGSADLSGETDHAFSRFPIAGDAEAGKPGVSGSFPEATEFSGYRVLDDSLIEKLAENIVSEVRARGPFLSLAEFVNRQLSSGDLALAGAVQSALNTLAKTSTTNPFAVIEAVSGPDARATSSPPLAELAEYRFPAAAEGYSAYGLPGWTRQADILRPLAPILSARDDTFTIRAHGDARDATGRVVSRAVCEAVVRRTRDYVDPADAADIAGFPTSAVNKSFGRRFVILSFRWLSPSEI